MQGFADRAHAGRVLAERLAGELDERYGRAGLIVLGLPRGGVPVAAAVADYLDAPLDILVVRKLGVPWQRELAMGAVAPYGTRVLNQRVVRHAGVTLAQLEEATARERAELDRQLSTYRRDLPPLDLTGRSVVIVDDGLATGASAHAAACAARSQQPKRVIVAAPVGAPQTVSQLAEAEGVDAVICALTPLDFVAVGQFYRRFDQVSDEEVLALLGC